MRQRRQLGVGGFTRVTLNRDTPLYHAIYTQHPSCKCMNSQAKKLGIERPNVRNRRPVANVNTRTSLIINGRAPNRAKTMNK